MGEGVDLNEDGGGGSEEEEEDDFGDEGVDLATKPRKTSLDQRLPMRTTRMKAKMVIMKSAWLVSEIVSKLWMGDSPLRLLQLLLRMEERSRLMICSPTSTHLPKSNMPQHLRQRRSHKRPRRFPLRFRNVNKIKSIVR